ncbi:MAG: CPBP family glutamic-type intramembrane protease [Chloroflexota bacterium]|nr:CPBP family glutamic-type intramembrane protease [Chloroflexota bacterium]
MNETPTDRREMSLMAKLTLPEAHEPPWSLLNALLAVLAMFICLAIIGPSFIAIITASATPTPFALMASWSLGMALTSLFVLVSRRSSEESWRALRLSRGELALPLALIIGLAIGLTLDLIAILTAGRFLPDAQIWALQTGGLPSLALAALLLVVLQPLAETLVFHAILLPRLRWRLGHWLGLAITAAVYAGLHYLIFFQTSDANFLRWHGLVLPMLLGISFGLLKVFSQSSLVALIARMGAGLIFLLTALALVGG